MFDIPLAVSASHGKPSSLVDTRVIYCGDNLEQLKKLSDGCVDLIYNVYYMLYAGKRGNEWQTGLAAAPFPQSLCVAEAQ